MITLRFTHGFIEVLALVTDYFGKYSVLFPCSSATANFMVKNVEDGILLVYGVPQHLICDNGPK